jgi:hypothetical protein
MSKGKGIVMTAAVGLCVMAGSTFACAKQATVPGHWEWQGNGHVWVPAHPTLPARAYAAWRDEAVASDVRDAAHQRDQRNAANEPRDLDRRLAR